MKAIILAAGLGSRLKHLTKAIPKALISVNHQRLIDYAINFVKDSVDEIIVIGGYSFDELKAHIEKQAIPNLTLIKNLDYKEGSILTIEKALDYLDDSFLLMNVDHIYPGSFMTKITSNLKGISGMCDFDRQLIADDMKVKLNGDKQIIQIDKKLLEYDGGYIGMTSCHQKMVSEYKRMVNTALEKGGRKVNVEFVLQLLADEGIYPNIVDLSGSTWLEIDDENDLRNGEKVLEAKPDLLDH